MLKRIVVAGAAVILVASLAAAHPHRSPGCGGEGRRGQLMQQLDLTEEQQKSLDQLRQAQQKSMQGLREELQAKAVELRNLTDANDPRAEQAREQFREIREEMQARRLAHRADVQKILTPEQQKKLEELRAERRGRQRMNW